MKILVTGGAGFIGSNFVHLMLDKYPDYQVLVLDALTYSGNKANLEDLESNPNYSFHLGDIRDKQLVAKLMPQVDAVVHFAAESHVDRSITDAEAFISTNVYGTYNILKAAYENRIQRFVHISTDEVYGDILTGESRETDPLIPSSPYAASKAASDLMVTSFKRTFDYPVMITRSSNNFGPYQYPEKVIPLFITNLLEDKPVPLYGDGLNRRDWIYVLDNCEGIDRVLHQGIPGEIYNIGGGNEISNLELTHIILKALQKDQSYIKPVKDRPGHDRRYALNCDKMKTQLGWQPRHGFERALELTLEWYGNNTAWWKKIKEKQEEYKNFTELWYSKR